MSQTWLLAFDATCCTCRSMSEVVADACDGKLEIVPLERADVVALRRRVLGAEPPHTPTLLVQHGAGWRGYTGPAMTLRLTRRLGVRSGARVVRALGAAVRGPQPDSVDQAPASGVNRRAFVQLGAGAAVAAGLLIAGRKPAAFATPQQQQVKAWIARNRSNLPTRYDEIVAEPPAYRRAIHAELTAAQRSAVWTTQLDRFAALSAPLSTAQHNAVARTRVLLAGPDTFADAVAGRAPGVALDREITGVRRDMEAAFGATAARRVLAELGPTPSESSASVHPDYPPCECSQSSDFCGGNCVGGVCYPDPNDVNCGFAYAYHCDGVCR